MKKTAICFAFIICAGFLQASEFKILAKTYFDAPNPGAIKSKSQIYYMPKVLQPAGSLPYFQALTYPGGAPRRRLKVSLTAEGYDGTGNALSFEKTNGKETMILCSKICEGEKKLLTSKKDLYVAFCIYSKENSGAYFLTFRNNTQKKNRKFGIKLPGGKWHVIKQRINGPNFFNPGDLVNSIGVYNCGLMVRNWQIDNFVVWQGIDKEAPTQVKDIEIKKDKDNNLIKWKAAKDNIFVKNYKIYRGTVKSFKPDKTCFVGETNKLFFVNQALMPHKYFYIIVAEDINGNCSTPSVAVSDK